MQKEIRSQEIDVSNEIDKAIDRIIDDECSRASKYLGKVGRFTYRSHTFEAPVVAVDIDMINSCWRLVFYFDVPEGTVDGGRTVSKTADEIVFV